MTMTAFEVLIIARICLDKRTFTDEYFEYSIPAADRTEAVLTARLNILQDIRAKYGDCGATLKVIYAKPE